LVWRKDVAGFVKKIKKKEKKGKNVIIDEV